MSEAALAPWLQRQLQPLLAQRGHAWLLHGPSGLGQYELALALVRAWLCERPDGGQGACGQCPSCHAVEVRAHADLCVLMPEAQMQLLGWPLDEKAQAELDEKKRKPGREIRVEAMRDAVEFVQRTSARGRGKAVLVFPAERMNAISANALLKTLEEPPGDVRFVLATGAAHLLLPTIRSRCMGHALAWPSADEAARWLGGQPGVDAADVPALLAAAGGRPDEAWRMAEAGRSARAWAALPAAMARGDLGAVSGWLPAELVDALQKLCHDLLCVGEGAAPRFFAAAGLPPPPRREALLRWSRALQDSARIAEHPLNAGLMLEALVAQARSNLNFRA
ncbi:DNA polymerase III subunit delta' [Pseudorhodoferax sp.]|uniref:DNA polymerase III subunit delta' n=1 Tax=Pseudorhodoferax sp. TaxID=1993553 RepID=UPI0039E51110